MSPDVIRQVLEAGANVAIKGGYGPQSITQWIQSAVSHGGTLTVSGSYGPQFLREWARLGGKHFTYRARPSAS